MPDDYTATTSTTGTIAVGGSATGEIEASRDVDWFAVELVAGRTYVIDLEGAGAGGGTLTDTLLFGVFDDEGSRVARKSAAGGEGGDARLVFTASETGTHYIAAKGFRKDDIGTYTVRVRDQNPPPTPAETPAVTPDPAPPQQPPARQRTVDTDAARAGATALGELAGARLSRQDSVDGGDDAADYYRFTLGETQVVTLGLRRQDADADLYLEDADGTVLHSSTRSGTQGEDIKATLEAGTYYVRVAAQEAGENEYRLRARAEEPAPSPVQAAPPTPGETPAVQPDPDAQAQLRQTLQTVPTSVSEPDGGDLLAGISTTGRVAVGGSATGRIAVKEDRDWFKVDLEAGKVYRFDLKGQDTGDGSLRDPALYGLYDAAGNVIAGRKAHYNWQNDDAGFGLNARGFFTPDADGAYFIDVASSVYAADSHRVGTYTLSVTEVGDDYAAATSTTGTLSVGTSGAGVIEHPDDRDWFKVDLEAGKIYRIDMIGDPRGGGFWDLYDERSREGVLGNPILHGIYDAQGAWLQGGDDDSGVGANARVFFTPAADATYYLEAGSEYTLRNRFTVGTYTLAVQEVEDAM